MLSYRHGFHTGNHADVIKHIIQIAILDYLTEKNKPFCYIDTHAGAGVYALTQGFSVQNQEFQTGIAPIWAKTHLPPLLAKYKSIIQSFNKSGDLIRYPGSPALANYFANKQMRLQLFEQHPQEYLVLKKWAKNNSHIQTYQEDGFTGLIRITPPKEKRGFILIDPSYEIKSDYLTLIDTLQKTLKRFSTGIYMIWHPLLAQDYKKIFIDKLSRLAPQWLYAQLYIAAPAQLTAGMYGSGVLVINPPWTLEKQLQETLPDLVKLLGFEGAGYHLSSSNSMV